MPEQLLDCPNILAEFQQMGSERVAKRMARHAFAPCSGRRRDGRCWDGERYSFPERTLRRRLGEIACEPGHGHTLMLRE
jgi:hypothetical protein